MMAQRSLSRIVPITPWVSVVAVRTPTLPPATHTNCVLLRDDSGRLVVIDPATPYPEEEAALAQAIADTGTPEAIWLTHHHRDHVGAAMALSARFAVPILAHRETRLLLSEVVRVDTDIAAGQHLGVGGGAPWVRAIYTPGHAPGHLCYFEERSRTLVAGDMVAGIGTIIIDPPEGDMALYLRSLEALRTIGARRLIPAHGPATPRVDQKLAGYIAHRLEREKRVVDALRAAGQPRAIVDLIPSVYADVPPMLYPLAARSLEAHLEKLVAEGRVHKSSASTFEAVATS
jgi:glyoxylase-like metal-dependent hydrolase (beta-lactamase superfamily II)